VDPYVPAGHGEHVTAPAREYCPAGQGAWVADADPAAHAYPALQLPVHPAVVKPAVDPYRPAGQFVHVTAAPVLYCPAAQGAVQAAVGRPWVDPYVPAGQLVHAVDPAVEYLPVPQMAVQVLTDSPAVAP
jgi:hypothetical protein